MNKLTAIVKNELIRYFISPLAYVYLLSFLLLNGSFAIYFGHFFDRGSADLLSMFVYQPWLYLLFIPGISMRLWAEEFRNKTVVQIVTMPVSVTQLVWGKFLASWLFCALALVLTFPFWLTVNLLGNPDNGVIAVGYLASFILAGCMLAISQTMSALTKNQVIALVLAVVANLIFFLSGLEYVLAFFRLFAPLPIIDMIASFSFITHFNTMAAGLIELRDAVFFISLILLFNFTTVLIVSFKTSGSSRQLKSGQRDYYILVFVLLLAGFVGLNLLANNVLRGVQYDFTEEKVYTLTEATEAVLKNLREPVTAKLYYSRVLEERNPDLRQMFDKLRILLRRYADIAGDKFDYRIYDPEPLSEREDQALAAGLQPLPIIDMNRNAYFGITLTDELDNRKVIPFFAMERLNFLEQDLTSKIFALGHEKKTVGLLTPLAMFDTMQDNNMVTPKWEIINQISEFFNIKKIEKPGDIEGVDVLMMVHPRNMSPEMIQKIRDYTLGGGRILAFADPAAEASRLFSPDNNDLEPSDFAGLDELWGFRFATEAVAADLNNSITVDATSSYKTNPTFTQDILQFILTPKNFNQRADETQELKSILFASASVIVPLYNNSRLNFIPLMKTSIVSELMPAAAAQKSIDPAVILQNFKPDTKEKIIAAKVVSLDKASPFEVIAVADTDMLYDAFWSKSQTVLDTAYVVPLLDNANFVLNALESLSGGESLIGLRGKSALKRPFAKVEKIRKNNERAFKVKEAEIFKKINQAKDNLQQVWGKKNFEERDNFTADELALIAGIRKNLESLRDELAGIKDSLNREIDRMDTGVKFLNIYLLPLLLALGLGVYFGLRSRKEKTPAYKYQKDPLAIGLALAAALLLSLGSLSVYYADKSGFDEYEDKPVFAGLGEKINEVDRIVIKTHEADLNFYREDGAWKLNNPAGLPVYQERVRSFLSALIEARLYEKKTANAEYLGRFGLNPREEAGSPNTLIELQNSAGKVIESLEVGRYDLDIGRGSRAAYIKFDKRFQVWLAEVDFIDLSPDWREWTYDTLWNLRFGRLSLYDDVSNPNQIAVLMKVLLNTYLNSEIANPEGLKQLTEINLVTEDGNEAKLFFYRDKSGKALVRYDFLKIENNNHLQFLEKSVKDRYYEINDSDMEKIENVLEFGKSGKTQ